MTPLVALLGGLAGAGIWLVFRGLIPDRPPLDVALADLERPRTPGHPEPRPAGPVARAVRATEDRAITATTRQRLDLVGRTTGRHAIDKIIYAAVFAALPVAVALVVALGGVDLAPTVTMATAAALAVVGFHVPEVTLRAEAARHRRRFLEATATYLDLVVVLLAGGRGIDGALTTAAESSDNPTFLLLRSALHTSAVKGESPWAGLDRLARHLDITPLAELAASATLAGEAGARVRSSLAAKATSMRTRILTDAEATANRRSETMSGPVVLMLAGFVVLIGFPALYVLLTL